MKISDSIGVQCYRARELDDCLKVSLPRVGGCPL